MIYIVLHNNSGKAETTTEKKAFLQTTIKKALEKFH